MSSHTDIMATINTRSTVRHIFQNFLRLNEVGCEINY